MTYQRCIVFLQVVGKFPGDNSITLKSLENHQKLQLKGEIICTILTLLIQFQCTNSPPANDFDWISPPVASTRLDSPRLGCSIVQYQLSVRGEHFMSEAREYSLLSKHKRNTRTLWEPFSLLSLYLYWELKTGSTWYKHTVKNSWKASIVFAGKCARAEKQL